MSRLHTLYQEDKRTKDIVEKITSSTPSRLLLSQMVGAQECFVLTAIKAQSNHNHIFIANDKEEAAYVQNTLDNIVPDKSVLFFPDSFRRPNVYDELDKNNVLIRTEAINKLNIRAQSAEILVTYPEAIFEKVADPALIDKEKIIITKGEDLDLDTIIELMVDYGFERTDFVYEPGQFSIRGGIVDIFSYGNEWPYRVELFDEEVESIRTFNPTDQMSIRNITKISIIPDINKKFRSDQKVSIFKVLPENAVVWIRDFDMVLDKLQISFEKAGEAAKNINVKNDEDLEQFFHDRAFIYPNEVLEEIGANHIIFQRKAQADVTYDLTIDYDAKPQPSFNKNFSLLIDDLREKEKAGIEAYLFTDNNRQIERFYNIFEDLQANVKFNPIVKAIHQGFIDKTLKIACFTDHQVFERFHRYKIRKGFTKEQAVNLKMLRELLPGDFVVHIDHGVGRYSGLEKIDINGHIQESVRLFYKNDDILYVSINSLHKISKFVGKDGTAPKLDKIGSDTWKKLKRKTKKKVKDIAKELIKLYAKRRAAEGFAFDEDGYLQNELEASFIYEDTPDQYKATNDVKEDMMKAHPMDRLICGDVGFGKTEIAIRAAFKAVVGGKQVAVLVPTTILALQHSKTFAERFKDFPVTVDYVNRFRTTAEKKDIFERLSEGKIDIIIGTHSILSKKIKFKDLGLLIIDEEQKFGVAAKEKLRNLKVNVDTLTLTATPIPRTLQFSLMAARDLSIIRTPPPNRQPIHTERRVFNDNLIRESIYYEVNRGGQVFFVHNRVKSLPDMTALLQRLCPDIDIAMAHGQMESKKLERTLTSFIDKKFDVLVCTNIIETGLDIANANTIIINNAHQFGLSDLHQLRGRVGRSNKKAYCYLFAPPLSVLTPDARKRIKTLEEFSDLGSGFEIAMKDLDIRGAGNMLGGEQSGFISDIGFETYQKILDEAIQELKETDFKDVFKEDNEKPGKQYVRDVEIETDIEMLIPDDYISNIQERLKLYTELDQINDEEALDKFQKMLTDRFGPLPKQVKELFHGLRLRWICKQMGFERLSLKKRKLRCYFISNPQSSFFEGEFFTAVLQYVATEAVTKGITLKQSTNFLILIKDNVSHLREAKIILSRMLEDITEKMKPPAAVVESA